MNEKVKKIVKWIAVIAAAIGAAAAVIIEQGCTNKYHLKANGIKVDTVEVSRSIKSSNMDKKFRNQMLAESKKREEELQNVNLEIEEREVAECGPFVLIRNKIYRDWETNG